eukprot:11222856-Lingulodinium_polyedra.AAC.1
MKRRPLRRGTARWQSLRWGRGSSSEPGGAPGPWWDRAKRATEFQTVLSMPNSSSSSPLSL